MDLQGTADFYDGCCIEHKESWRACCWSSEEDQYLQFSVMANHMIDWQDLSGISVLDIGCGQGDFYNYLLKRNNTIQYTGIDVSPEMIKIAKEKNPNANFIQGGFLEKDLESYDYVFSIGAFNSIREGNQLDFLDKCIEKMLKITKRTAGLMLTNQVIQSNFPLIYHYNPADVLSHCLKYTHFLNLNHTSLFSQMAFFIFPLQKE